MIIEREAESYQTCFKDYKMGYLDCENKVVLDVGADFGSTSCIFLNQGAKEVIGVEKNPAYVERYKDNFSDKERAKIIHKFVDDKKFWTKIIQEKEPDVAQIDCEGCEKYLLEVKDSLFSSISEYHVECHNNKILIGFLKKFKSNGFRIMDVFVNINHPRIMMIWAKREKDEERFNET